MEQRRRSRGEAEIEALLAKLPPGSERHRVLTAARDFKASWVALGERLTQVRESGQHAQWGYKTFEAYVRGELRMKPDTAVKLTRSYSFLRDHEPTALEAPMTRELPALDVVDLLSRAREKTKVSEQQLDSIRRDAFDSDEGPLSKSEVMKRFREVDPEAFKASAKKPGAATSAGDGNVRKALLLSERLESLLAAIPGISDDVPMRAASVTGELRAIFEATRQQPTAQAAA